jgi:hypothetical protein
MMSSLAQEFDTVCAYCARTAKSPADFLDWKAAAVFSDAVWHRIRVKLRATLQA